MGLSTTFKTFILSLLIALSSSFIWADAGKFEDVEIRVISPRYFSKRKRFELGTQFNAITNQTFIYTYMFSGLLSYHFTESLGLRFSAAYGSSSDKNDKVALDKDFGIKTQIVSTQSIYGLDILWTPIYGKYQLRSGRLIYFDTFVSVGGALTEAYYSYDNCSAVRNSAGEIVANKRAARSVSYPTFSSGVGQRFFINKEDAFNWDIKSQFFQVPAGDGSCVEGDASGATSINQNISIQLGYSRFF